MPQSLLGRSVENGTLRAATRLIWRVALVWFAVLRIEVACGDAAEPPPQQFPVVGLIGTKHKQLGGSTGLLGRAISKEKDSTEGKGRYQTFEHGAIGWSPATGPKSVQAAYAKGLDLVFEWGDTLPFNYDFFIVRWDLDGKNVGQQDIKGGSRTSGQWVTHPGTSGRYRLAVEGADGHPGGSKSKQGWSNSLYVDFVVPPPIPTKYKQLGGSAGPLGRAIGKETPSREGKGKYQKYEHGVIGWSPSTGPNSVQALYLKGPYEMVFEWGDTSPFNYDFFNVRWDMDGTNMGQSEVKGTTRTSGKWITRPHSAGLYRVTVEGGDKHTIGKDSFRQGWSNALEIYFVPLAPEYSYKPPTTKLPEPSPAHDCVHLENVAPATSVSDAKANFDNRAAAAIRYEAAAPIGVSLSGDGQTYGGLILSKLAYFDYFKGDGRGYRNEASQSLLGQRVASKSGTTTDTSVGITILTAGVERKRTGDYDVGLTALTAIIYKYYHVLPPKVQNHIINNLLNKSGPFDPADQLPFGALPPVPESENHVMMIETSRYLTNQLLYRRQGDVQYDNSRNGMDEWMLKHLQQFLLRDFIEYNARPYQDYTLSALLNLYTFTSDRHPSGARVKTAAHMVLDYLMAKVAVSSNDSRRSVTFRRKSDKSDNYNDPNFLDGSTGRMDPQNAFSMQFAGTTDMANSIDPANKRQQKTLPGHFGWEMQWAGLSDYRLPDTILDLMVNRSHRVFFQRFHHDGADEAYAGSPSYLISSGGHYTTFAYAVGGMGKHDDTGLALPTTFMPTGQFTTRDDLIRFEGDSDDVKRSNMGVAPDFACGLNPIVPSSYQSVAVGVDNEGHPTTPPPHATALWTFIDQSINRVQVYPTGQFHPGYYVAVYRRDGFGFLEAYDTALHPGLKFEEFRAGVIKRNGATSFSITGWNSYVMTDGRTIQFEISPNSVVRLPAESPFFVKGTILNGAERSGVITIDNPVLHKRITLDMSHWNAPKRTEN
jgi:hypothetical protein